MACCEDCKELIFDSCLDSISFDTDLTADDTYYFWITDKFDNKQIQEIVIGANGLVTVDLTLFHEGGLEFNEFAGSFFVTCSTSESEETNEVMTIAGEQYTCIKIDFKNIVSTN